MTAPVPKNRRTPIRIAALLVAPLLALGLGLPAAQAANAPHARSTLQGLKLADEPTVPTLRERIVQAGLDAIGTPYSWGGDDPIYGFDCSGLVLFVYREIAGLELPRTARAQRQTGAAVVSRQQLKPGDLVFFSIRGRTVSHVGIYVGQNRFVHAPTRGAAVRVDAMNSKYWSGRYAGARRYLDPVAPGRLLAHN